MTGTAGTPCPGSDRRLDDESPASARGDRDSRA